MKRLNYSTFIPSQKRQTYKRKNALLILSIAALLMMAAIVFPEIRARVTAASQPQKSSPDQAISESALLQIKALLDEKESRTPAQQKLASQLIYARKMYHGQSLAAGIPTLEVNVGLDNVGYVVVDITTSVDDKLLAAVKATGAEIVLVSETYHSLRVRAPSDQLETIAGYPQVRFIQPKQEAILSQNMIPTDVLSSRTI